MILTEADQTKVQKWLEKKCGQLRCFCCGHAQWQLMNISGITLGFDTHTTRFHYHDGVPTVSIACSNCAHLVSFAAVLLGLTPDPPASGDATKA